MDEWQFEIASRNEEAARLEAQQRASDMFSSEPVPELCGCGEPIGDFRRKIGLKTCFDCANALEAIGRNYR